MSNIYDRVVGDRCDKKFDCQTIKTLQLIMRLKLLILLLVISSINLFSQNTNYFWEKQGDDGFKWVPYSEYGRHGALSALTGEIIIPAKYETCNYEGGHFIVKNNIGEMGVFDKNGKVIIPSKGIYSISTIAGIKNHSPYVVLDVETQSNRVYSYEGKEIISSKQYRSITPYVTSKGLYYVVVAKNGLYGLIDAEGNILIEANKFNALAIYDTNYTIYVSYIIYGDNHSAGICDTNGNIIISTRYSVVVPELDSSNNLYFKTVLGDTFGKISLDGTILKKPVIKKTYNPVTIGDKTYYIVVDENAYWGIANEFKQIIIPCENDFIFLKGSYFTVKKGRYMGLVNKDLKNVISTEKKYVTVANMDNVKHPFLIGITEESKWGVYDVSGKQLVAPMYTTAQYDIFESTKDTILLYKQGALWGANRINGSTIVPPLYKEVSLLDTPAGRYFNVFNQNNLVGLCNYDGIEIIEPQFTNISFNRRKGKDFFYATNGDYAAIFNIDGTQLINGETFSEIIYDEKEKQFIATQGKRKCYFTTEGILIKDNSLDIEQDKYISIADNYFEEGKYKLAAKNYGLALNIRPTASLFFNRGVSYYNMNKYDDAISDFKRCLESNPSKNLYSRSIELIDTAEEYLYQKEQRRSRIAGAIFGLVLTGANMYFEAQSQKQQNRYKASYTNTISHSSRSNQAYNEEQESSSSSSNTSCPSLRVNRGKWYCGNTGECGMCNGTGHVDDGFGLSTKHDCTLCGGSGKCKYCR